MNTISPEVLRVAGLFQRLNERGKNSLTALLDCLHQSTAAVMETLKYAPLILFSSCTYSIFYFFLSSPRIHFSIINCPQDLNYMYFLENKLTNFIEYPILFYLEIFCENEQILILFLIEMKTLRTRSLYC